MVETHISDMARAEHPDRYSWWLNELESPGISTHMKEASELTEEIKQIFYEEYQKAYNEK